MSQTLRSRPCNIFSSTAAISGEHVTKLVPKLSPVEECVDVPKVSALINGIVDSALIMLRV